MTKKERREYRRQKEAQRSEEIRKMLERPMLDLMRQLRRYTVHPEPGIVDPRGRALADLRVAIDSLGAIVTGDAEYFHAKHHSIGPTPKS